MSTQIFPLAVWQSGTNENSIPANDNALRVQVLMGPAVDVSDSEPASPSEDDQYIVGIAWGGFTTNNVVIYKGGNFLEFDAFDGWVKVIDGVQSYFNGASWVAGGGGGGGGVSSVGMTVPDGFQVSGSPITSAGTFGLTYSPGYQGYTTEESEKVAELGTVATISYPGGTSTFLRADGTFAAPQYTNLIDVSSPAISSGTLTLNFSGGSTYAGMVILNANVTTLAFSNLPSAGLYAQYELHIRQDATGSRTLTIPASHKALGGSDTAIASAAGAVTVLSASTVDGGVTWRYAMQESAV